MPVRSLTSLLKTSLRIRTVDLASYFAVVVELLAIAVILFAATLIGLLLSAMFVAIEIEIEVPVLI